MRNCRTTSAAGDDGLQWKRYLWGEVTHQTNTAPSGEHNHCGGERGA